MQFKVKRQVPLRELMKACCEEVFAYEADPFQLDGRHICVYLEGEEEYGHIPSADRGLLKKRPRQGFVIPETHTPSGRHSLVLACPHYHSPLSVSLHMMSLTWV